MYRRIRISQQLALLGLLASPGIALAFCPPNNFSCQQQEQQQRMQEMHRQQQMQQQQAQQRQQQMQQQQAQQRMQEMQRQQQMQRQQAQQQRIQQQQMQQHRTQEMQRQQQTSRPQPASPYGNAQRHGNNAGVTFTPSHNATPQNRGIPFNDRNATVMPHTRPAPEYGRNAQSHTPHRATATPTQNTGNPSQQTRTSNNIRPIQHTQTQHATPSAQTPARTPSQTPVRPASLPNTPNTRLTSVQAINTHRQTLTGINQHALPKGTVTKQANGGAVVRTANHVQYGVRPDGKLNYVSHANTRATFTPNGQIRTLHTSTMNIARPLTGYRVVGWHTPGTGRSGVSYGPRQGYVQEAVNRGKQHYFVRTYVAGSHVFTRAYAPYRFRGAELLRYVPAVALPAAYYAWTHNAAWTQAVKYAWNWASASWYQDQSDYFAAQSDYDDPSSWLSDYVMGSTLQAAYDTDMGANSDTPDYGYDADSNVAPSADAASSTNGAASADGATPTIAAMPPGDMAVAQAATPITPTVRRQLVAQTQAQIADQAAAIKTPAKAVDLTGLTNALRPHHLFIANQPLKVQTTEDKSCRLAPGDVISLQDAPAESSLITNLMVVSSHKGSCPADAVVVVKLEDLQDMNNAALAQLDSGLQALHEKQGQQGLPAAPQDAQAKAAIIDEKLATPVKDGPALVQSAQQNANKEEASALALVAGK